LFVRWASILKGKPIKEKSLSVSTLTKNR